MILIRLVRVGSEGRMDSEAQFELQAWTPATARNKNNDSFSIDFKKHYLIQQDNPNKKCHLYLLWQNKLLQSIVDHLDINF